MAAPPGPRRAARARPAAAAVPRRRVRVHGRAGAGPRQRRGRRDRGAGGDRPGRHGTARGRSGDRRPAGRGRHRRGGHRGHRRSSPRALLQPGGGTPLRLSRRRGRRPVDADARRGAPAAVRVLVPGPAGSGRDAPRRHGGAPQGRLRVRGLGQRAVDARRGRTAPRGRHPRARRHRPPARAATARADRAALPGADHRQGSRWPLPDVQLRRRAGPRRGSGRGRRTHGRGDLPARRRATVRRRRPGGAREGRADDLQRGVRRSPVRRPRSSRSRASAVGSRAWASSAPR